MFARMTPAPCIRKCKRKAPAFAGAFLRKCSNFRLSFCYVWKYVAPTVRQRPQAAKAFSSRRRWPSVSEVGCGGLRSRICVFGRFAATPHQSASLTASPQGEAFCAAQRRCRPPGPTGSVSQQHDKSQFKKGRVLRHVLFIFSSAGSAGAGLPPGAASGRPCFC